MNGFYELPVTRHMPTSPGWGEVKFRALSEVDSVSLNLAVFEFRTNPDFHLLAFSPASVCSPAEGVETWTTTLVYQEKVDPNGGVE